MGGTCYLKGVLAQPTSDQRDLGHFTPGWKGGQNIFIDKGKVVLLLLVCFIKFTGSICPGGYLNTHTYVTWSKESDLDSYASNALTAYFFFFFYGFHFSCQGVPTRFKQCSH